MGSKFNNGGGGVRPDAVSRVRKDNQLGAMSEDVFRDKVVRPLFLRLGFKDGRELCGPQEHGKDMVFVERNALKIDEVVAVQTKKGRLNLGKKATDNVIDAVTQLKTALATPVVFLAKKEKKCPSKIILCASGTINDSAKQYILTEVRDPRISFMDRDDLIPLIDERFPELWLSIESDLMPYLHAVVEHVEQSSEDVSGLEVGHGDTSLAAATDAMFVPLRLYRVRVVPEKDHGRLTEVPKFEDIPLTDLLARSGSPFLILGEAGAGKSTCMRRLAYVLAKRGLEDLKRYVVPIVLRASDVLRSGGGTLAEISRQQTAKYVPTDKPAFLPEDLSNGRVVVLVDALDEIPDDGAREQVLDRVLEFQKSHPTCRVIASTRDYEFVGRLPQFRAFQQWYLSPIDFRQVGQILTRLHKQKALPAEAAQEILRRLQDVHGMNLNPLLVTVFAATTDYSRKDIPANITELFKKYTEMMLGRWDARKGFAQQYQADLKDFVLRQVAFAMHKRRVTSLTVAELRAQVEAELAARGHKADSAQLTDEILQRSGLFRVLGERVEFRHLLLQEFFAGRGIPARNALEQFIGDGWWQRAIVFYFGENPEDGAGLAVMAGTLERRPKPEVFHGAITLGLALQACYLVRVQDKVMIFRAVVDSLGAVKEDFLRAMDSEGRFPLSRFLHYYLFGRDAVACSILADYQSDVDGEWGRRPVPADLAEMRTFWQIIGLIEIGALESAEALVENFRPTDPRLLLAIHLGCVMIEHLRVARANQRNVAARVSHALSDKIAHLRKQLLDEVNSELLEIRQGRVQPLELPPPGPASDSE